MSRSTLLAILCLFLSASASAQDTACTYERCALWIDRTTVRRGAEGAVVLRDGFLRPMPLRAYVANDDSAAAWARQFERRAATGQAMSNLGLLAIVVGVSTQYLRVRNNSSADDANAFEATLAFGGLLSFVAGAATRTTAEPFRARAVWWYNRRFTTSRPP